MRRAPKSAAMAEPAAPAMSSAVAMGPASRTTASTAAEPVNDWAPNCLIRPPTCRAMTAPNGIDDKCGRDDRHLDDEPGLEEELLQLERSPEQRDDDVEREGEQVAGDSVRDRR